MLAMAAVALGFTSCKQEDEPQYHAPTTFTVNTPALQDQAFRTSDDMTDPETFNLFCSQPDYGYSAICKYSALVSLDENAPIEDWIEIPAQNPSSASMAIKTYDLGVAVNKLLGVDEESQFTTEMANTAYKVFFRAVCEIEAIEGSRIVSSNYVSYNKVYIKYAVEKPGWIYIAGTVENEDGIYEGFGGPNAANANMQNFRLFEPEDLIGQKLYVGIFSLRPQPFPNDKVTEADAYNIDNPDACSQFRFFTELLGWTDTASYGSAKDDFYVLNTKDEFMAGYEGTLVPQGLGNFGVFIPMDHAPVPTTFVVDIPGLKVYYLEGAHTVEFTGRVPTFN